MRQTAIPGKFSTEPLQIMLTIDKVTEHWPVPVNFHDTMDQIKHTHCAVHLQELFNDKLVTVNNITNILTGALIEIHFELHHYAIHGSNPPLDLLKKS
jgi:hypothetical protein